jgi:hypothetical protein
MLHKLDAISDQEMKRAYEDLGDDDFFDTDPDADQVERVLGVEVRDEYMRWIYLNIK